MQAQRNIRIQTRKKWRPSLAMVVFSVLVTVMTMPLIGLVFFRLYENQLIRQTESELISQAAVLSALYAQELKGKLHADPPLGPVRPLKYWPNPLEPYHPISPKLDVRFEDVLPRRPSARPTIRRPHLVYEEIGKKLHEISFETQKTTLSGFRILDPTGQIVGGKYEMGMSLSHIHEVSRAMRGEYVTVLRQRISDEPPPPLYSISRGTSIRIFLAMPVILNNRVGGVIYMSRTPNNIIKHLYSERRTVILAGSTLLIVTLIIGFIFWRTITGPIYTLTQRTSAIANGNRMAITPLNKHGTKELAQLSQSFLNMAQSLVDRADYISTFAAHVSHELKSPLTSIQGAAELLRDANGSMTPEERNRFLGNIITDTERLTALLSRLRELARADNPTTGGTVKFSHVAKELVYLFADENIEINGIQDINLNMSLENSVIVISHLIDNALRHQASEIKLDISADAVNVNITVSDNGDGISEKNREKIFEAFFTTRRESGGTGMGLGIVQSLLQAHGGSVELLPSTEVKGACFLLKIPVA